MKLRLPVRLLAAVVAAASHVAFLTVASASGAWAVENASVDLTFVDSADAPAIVADGESLAELPSAQSAEEAVVTLSDAEAEKVTAADAALPEEIAAAGDSVVVTAPMTAEDVAEVSAAPEVASVGGANTTQNVTSELLQSQENSLVSEYNAFMAGNTGTETPAVSYPANNAAETQTAAAANLTVPETAVASDNTTTQNLSAASAAAPQTAALTTETVSGSTGTAGSSSAVSSSYSAPTFMTTGADVSAPRSAPVVFLTGAVTDVPDTWYVVTDGETVSYDTASMDGKAGFYVGEGATFKVSGGQLGGPNPGARPVTLAAGATLEATADAGFGSRQINILTLDGDAAVAVNYQIGVINNNYKASTLTLNGYKLSLTHSGSGVKEFWLYSTSVSAGTINVGAGVTVMTNGSTTFNDATLLEIAAGGVVDYSAVRYSDNGAEARGEKFVKLLNAASGAGTLKLGMNSGDTQITNKDIPFGANYEIVGADRNASGLAVSNLRLNTWGGQKTYTIASGKSLTLDKVNLRLESQAKMAVNGTLSVADRIQLGYASSDAAENTQGGLSIVGGSVIAKEFEVLYAGSGSNSNQLDMSSGSLRITGANMFTNQSNPLNASFTGGALVAEGNSWVMNRVATVSNVSVRSLSGNSITLGVRGNDAAVVTMGGTINATSGHLILENAKVATDGAATLNGHVTIVGAVGNGGTLEFADNSTIGITHMTLSAGGQFSEDGENTGANGFLLDDAVLLASGGAYQYTQQNLTLQRDGVTDSSLSLIQRDNANGSKDLLMGGFSTEGTYFVNSGTVTYADGQAVAGSGVTEIALCGGTLDVQKSLTSGTGIVAYTNSEITIAQDRTVDASAVSVSGEVADITISGQGAVRMNDASKLSLFVGSGNMLVDSNVTFGDGAATKLTGTLTVSKGATLTLGTKDGQTVSVASFRNVALDNGTLKVEASGSTLNNLSVSAGGGELHVRDSNAAQDNIRLLGTTTLTGNLTLSGNWNSQITVDSLSGAGNLIVKNIGMDSTSRDRMYLKLRNIDGWTGALNIDNNQGGSTNHPELQMAFGASEAAFTMSNKVNLNAGSVRMYVGRNDGLVTTKQVTLADVAMSNGTAITAHFWRNGSDYKYNIGKLTMKDETATLAVENHGGWTSLGSLSGNGTLTLRNAAASTAHTTFSLGGASGATTGFTGIIDVNHSNDGDKRCTLIALNDAVTAANAELRISAVQTNNNRAIGVGITANTVKLAGLNEGTIGSAGANSQYALFSRADVTTMGDYGGGTAYFNGASDGTKRTLELTGAETYSTGIKVLSGVSLTMSGRGSQTFSGDMTAFNGDISVSNGMLKLSGSGLGNSTRIGALTLTGGTLDLSALTSTVQTGALTLGSPVMALAEGEATAATLKLGTQALNAASVTLNAGKLDVSTFLIGRAAGSEDVILISSAAAIDETALSNIRLTGNTGDWADARLAVSGNNLVLALTPVTDNYWKDSDGNWSDEDGWYDTAALTGDAHAFVSGNVYFANTHTVNLTADVTAKNMVVSGGKTLTLDTGVYNLAASSLTGGDDAQGGNLIKKGTGSVSINGLVSMTGLDVQGGTVSVVGVLSGQDKGSIGEIKSSAGTTLSLANVTANVTGSNNQQLKGSLTIGSGAVVNVSNTDNMDFNATNTIRIETDGELHFNDGGRWTVGSNNKIVMAGGSVTGNGASGDGALDFYRSNTLKAEKTSIISAPVRLRGDVTVDVDANQTLTMGTITQQGGDRTLTKAGEGTLTLTSTLSNSTVTVTGGVLDLNDKQHSNLNTLNITNATVKTTSNNGNGCVGGTININSGGRFEVNGGHDALGWSDGSKYNYTDKLVLQGTDNTEAGRATLYLNQTTDYSVTMSSVIEMKGNARIQNGTKSDGTQKKGFNTFTGCSIAVSGTNNRIDSIDVRKNATLTTNAGAELTIGKLTKNREAESDNAVLTKAGDGTLILDGDTANPYITISGGTLNLLSTVNTVGSALTMGSGTTLALSEMDDNAVTFTSLTFSGSGTLDLSRLDLSSQASSYTLATSTGGISGWESVVFTLGDGVSADGYTLSVVDGNTLVLNYTPAPTNLIWVGGEHVWDTDRHHKSWYEKDPSTAIPYTQEANVRFAASETPAVALLQENVEAGLMTVDSGADVTIRNGDDAVPHTLTVQELVVEGVLHTQAALNVTDSLTIRNAEAEGALPAKVKMEAFEDFDLSTPIMGNGMLEKSGQGTVTITNTNTAFTGSLIVEEGTVVLGTTDAMRSADVMVCTDAGLKLDQANTTVNSLWLEDGAILSFNTGATLVADGADMMGAILSPNSIINLFDYDIDSEIPESITLVTATNGIALGDEDGSVLLTMPTGYHGSLALSEDGRTLSLVNITHVDPYYWKGGNGMWDTAETNKSWYVGAEGTEPVAFVQDKDVVFDDRAAVSAVTVNGTMDVTTMTVEAGTDVTLIGGKLAANKIILNGNLTTQGDVTANLVDLHGENSRWNIATAGTDRTFSGVISHHGTLVKSGDGTLTLTADNSAFSGVTQLQEGKIIAANEAGHALGGAPRVEMGDGTELDGKLAVVHGHTHASVEVAKGFATLSAALTLHEESQITLGGAGTLNATGAISGSGAVLKDGAGILMLSGNNSYSGGTTISSGTVEVLSANALGTGNVQVNAGAYLKLDSQTLRHENESVAVGGDLRVLSAGTLAVGSNNNLSVSGALTFGTGTVFDLSGVTLDSNGKAVLGTVNTGISSFDGSYSNGRLNNVALENLVGSTGAAAGVKSAHLYYDSTKKELYVLMEEAGKGYYWTGKTEGLTVNYSGNWKDSVWAETNGQGSGTKPYVSLNSAYFMNAATADVTVDGDYIVNQLIVGAGNYTFNGTGTLSLSDNNHSYLKDAGIIVREGASATFNVAVGGSADMSLQVEKNASLKMDNVMDATFNDVYVAGTMDLVANNAVLVRSVIAETGKVTIHAPNDYVDVESYLSAAQIVNSGALTISVGRFVYQMGVGIEDSNALRGIYNQGTITFDTTNARYIDYTGDEELHDGVNVVANLTGGGDVVTRGSGKVQFDDSWLKYGNIGYLSYVDAADITLGAKETEFDAQVTSTGTLKLTAEAFAEDDDKRSLTSFMASASLNKVEMGADTTLHFQGGRESLGETHNTSGIYTMDSVTTTGTDQRIEVMSSAKVNVAHAVKAQDGALIVGDKANQQDDATFHSGDNVSLNGLEVNSQAVVDFAGAANTVTTFDMNGGTFTAAGTNTVTTLNQTGGSISLNREGTGANTIDTVNMTGGTLTAKGDTSIDKLNQSGTGSVVTLEQGGTLGEKGAADAGTVSGGTLTLGNNAVLRQEAVVNVEAGGSYTLASTTGSINASDLTLERTSGGYKEVFNRTTLDTGSTMTESGFMTSGSELVKLFDMGSDATLTSNGMTVSHALASGQMTLIGTDNMANFRAAMAGDNKDVNDYVGWAYLHTAETSYVTYYVRDNYVTGELDGRVSAHADDKGQLTLSDIQSAAADASSQKQELGGIVFDRTDYNKGVSGYHGTLTVDENASADMFAVTSGTNAMIHLTDRAVVKADSSYRGVQGTLALQGLGVYELENRADLGANVSLRDNNATGDDNEWNGTVRVTGTAENLSMKGLSVGAGDDASTIEFKNWSGTFMEDGNAYTSSAHVVLTGVGTKADPAAITIKGGDALTYTWDNSVSSNGQTAAVVHESGDDFTLNVTGDASEWTGRYDQNAGTSDKLTFTGGTAVHVDSVVSKGSLSTTYGGAVKTVDGQAVVYNGSSLDLHYTGTGMAVSGDIYSETGSKLTLTVGDGTAAADATFSGLFLNTGEATMHVEDNSAATLATNAALLRVVGDAGSMVTVNEGETLTLTSTEAETYSEFHGLTNDGTIAMKADGGDIHLVVDDGAEGGTTFDMGSLELDGGDGIAHVGADTTNGKATVNISDLKSSESGDQKLVLQNMYGTGEVDYNLDLTDEEGGAQFHGKIRFGTEDSSVTDGTTRVVLGSENVAADAVLESVGNGTAADVVVDTDKAKVKGITSEGQAVVGGKVYGTAGEGEGNKQLVITGNDTYSYNGAMGENLDVAYTGSGKQTFEGGVDGFNGAVTVGDAELKAGVMEILQVAQMDITDLTIGQNNELVLKDDSGNGTAHVSSGVVALGTGVDTASKLEGSLTLAADATLDVAAAGGVGGINLSGSDDVLTFNGKIKLAEDSLTAIKSLDAWTYGQYDLAFGVETLNLFGREETRSAIEYGQVDAAMYIAGLESGRYYLVYSGADAGGNGGQVGTLSVVVPEPTTSTLSLLALAALCARRRRKA